MDLSRLALVASSLLGAESEQDVVETVLRQGMAAVGADAALLYLADPEAGLLRLVAFDGIGTSRTPAGSHTRLDGGLPAGRAALTGKPVWAGDLARRGAGASRGLPPPASGATAAIPFMLPCPRRWVLEVRFPEARGFGSEERLYLRTLAAQAALALRVLGPTQGRPATAEGTADLHRRLVDEMQLEQNLTAAGSWHWSAATGTVTWSAQMYRIFGIDPATDEAAFPAALASVTHPDDAQVVAQARERALADREPFTVHQRLFHPGGAVRHTVSRGEVVVDETGAVTGIRGTTQDVTAQVESAVELAGAREALSLRTLERDQEQRVKEALQQVVLPPGLPALPRVSIAAAYQSADVPAEVGGDWYDAFEVSADQLVVAVGDVSGHDLASAAAMGQLRNSLRGYAMEGHRPAAVLTRLNQLMRAFSPDLLASAIYGHLDTSTALFTWACAGHPPPIVVSPLGCRLLQPPAGVLLGAASGPHFATAHMTLGGRQILLLYTDGLVERRGAGLTEGIERLLRVAAEAPAEDVDVFCAEVVGRMTSGENLPDDLCVLALRVSGATG